MKALQKFKSFSLLIFSLYKTINASTYGQLDHISYHADAGSFYPPYYSAQSNSSLHQHEPFPPQQQHYQPMHGYHNDTHNHQSHHPYRRHHQYDMQRYANGTFNQQFHQTLPNLQYGMQVNSFNTSNNPPYQHLQSPQYIVYERHRYIMPQQQPVNGLQCHSHAHQNTMCQLNCRSLHNPHQFSAPQQNLGYPQYPYQPHSVQDQLSMYGQQDTSLRYHHHQHFQHMQDGTHGQQHGTFDSQSNEGLYGQNGMPQNHGSRYFHHSHHQPSIQYHSYEQQSQINPFTQQSHYPSAGHSHHTASHHRLPNEPEQHNTSSNTSYTTSNSASESQSTFIGEDASNVNIDQGIPTSYTQFSEEESALNMQAERRIEILDDLFLLINDELETQTTNFQQNQQDSMPETLNSFPSTILPSNEEYFTDIIADYSKFKDLDIGESIAFIEKTLKKFEDTDINDSFANFTLDGFKETEKFIEYSDEEKIELEKIGTLFSKILIEMDKSIDYVLSLQNLEKLISNCEKYVESEKEILNSLKNGIVFQKYILNYIKKIIEENEANLSLLFYEIISLRSFIWLNFRSLFFTGNGLKMVYLFKILTSYTRKKDKIDLYKGKNQQYNYHKDIKPTRYILRRIILEISYNLGISQSHIRLFSIVSYFDLLIYKIIKLNLIRSIPVKKIVLFNSFSSIFFVLNSNEVMCIKNVFIEIISEVRNEYSDFSQYDGIEKMRWAEKTLEIISEFFFKKNICYHEVFLISICNKFIFLININQNLNFYRLKGESMSIKKANMLLQNFLLNMKKINNKELAISKNHVKFIYMVYGIKVFYRLDLVIFYLYNNFNVDLEHLKTFLNI